MFECRSRVLIADGDAWLRRHLNQRLLDVEVFADTAADVKDALDRLAASQYGVVVLDLQLSGGPAERVLDAISKLPLSARPVVLVLANRTNARSLDVDIVQIVLRKPCDVRQLAEIIESCAKNTPEPAQRTEPMIVPQLDAAQNEQAVN